MSAQLIDLCFLRLNMLRCLFLSVSMQCQASSHSPAPASIPHTRWSPLRSSIKLLKSNLLRRHSLSCNPKTVVKKTHPLSTNINSLKQGATPTTAFHSATPHPATSPQTSQAQPSQSPTAHPLIHGSRLFPSLAFPAPAEQKLWARHFTNAIKAGGYPDVSSHHLAPHLLRLSLREHTSINCSSIPIGLTTT